MMKTLCHIACLALAVPGLVHAADKQTDHAKRMLAQAEFALAATGTVTAAAWPDTNILFRVAWWPRANLLRVKATLQDVVAGKSDLWDRNAYAIHHNSFTVLASGKAVLAEHTTMRVRDHWSGSITSDQRQRVVSQFTVALPARSALKEPLPPSSVRLLIESRQSEGRKQTHCYLENDKVIYDLLSAIGVKTRRSQQAESTVPVKAAPSASSPVR